MDKMKIVKEVEECNNITKISKKYGIDRKTIRNWIKKYKAGDFETLKQKKRNNDKIDYITINKIIEQVKSNPDLNAYELAKKFNISKTSIQTILNDYKYNRLKDRWTLYRDNKLKINHNFTDYEIKRISKYDKDFKLIKTGDYITKESWNKIKKRIYEIHDEFERLIFKEKDLVNKIEFVYEKCNFASNPTRYKMLKEKLYDNKQIKKYLKRFLIEHLYTKPL